MESSEYSRGEQAADFHLVDGAKSSPHAHGQESQRQVFKCPEVSKDRHEGKKIKIICWPKAPQERDSRNSDTLLKPRGGRTTQGLTFPP